MATKEQIQAWKLEIADYKAKYGSYYSGKRPSDKMIGNFCDLYGIPWPLPDAEEEFDFLE